MFYHYNKLILCVHYLLEHFYIILQLLDTLLIGCQDKDESIRLCYGECLGELGAIEPSLLPRRIISRGIEFKKKFFLNSYCLYFIIIFLICF